jgi:hypothetical protein
MGRVQKNLPQGLNRLRKNPERMEKIPRRVPQGLKCLRENYTRYL